MNEKQQKSFDRSIKRAAAQSGNDEGEKLGLFIRVAESNIYKGKILHKALLKEVIYLRRIVGILIFSANGSPRNRDSRAL